MAIKKDNYELINSLRQRFLYYYDTRRYTKKESCQRVAKEFQSTLGLLSWITVYQWVTPGIMDARRQEARNRYYNNPEPQKEYSRNYNKRPEVRKKQRLYMHQPYVLLQQNIYNRVCRHFPEFLYSIYAQENVLTLSDITLRLEKDTKKHFLESTVKRLIDQYKNKDPPLVTEVKQNTYQLNV